MNCRICQFFYVTYDPNQPLGCKAYGIKSRQLPAIIVLRASSESCHFYKERHTKKSMAHNGNASNKPTKKNSKNNGILNIKG